jgi:hypothetical protein
MGASLVGEGILSACYHICPTGINFQFDTTFMYALSLLIFLKVYQFRHLRITPPATSTGLFLAILLYLEVSGYFFDHWAFWIVFVLFYLGVTNYIILKIYRSEELSHPEGGQRVSVQTYSQLRSGQETGPPAPAVWSWRNIRTRPILAVVVANVSLAIYILICHTPGVSSYILLILSVNMALYFFYYLACKMYYR